MYISKLATMSLRLPIAMCVNTWYLATNLIVLLTGCHLQCTQNDEDCSLGHYFWNRVCKDMPTCLVYPHLGCYINFLTLFLSTAQLYLQSITLTFKLCSSTNAYSSHSKDNRSFSNIFTLQNKKVASISQLVTMTTIQRYRHIVIHFSTGHSCNIRLLHYQKLLCKILLKGQHSKCTNVKVTTNVPTKSHSMFIFANSIEQLKKTA